MEKQGTVRGKSVNPITLRQILYFELMGLSNAETALSLGLSKQTVDRHKIKYPYKALKKIAAGKLSEISLDELMGVMKR